MFVAWLIDLKASGSWLLTSLPDLKLMCSLLAKCCIFPANTRLDEDFLKTSFVFIFRRRLQDVLIKTNMFSLALRLQKTSSRRLAKTFSRRFQDVFKRSSRRLAKISSRCFQDVPSS